MPNACIAEGGTRQSEVGVVERVEEVASKFGVVALFDGEGPGEGEIEIDDARGANYAQAFIAEGEVGRL